MAVPEKWLEQQLIPKLLKLLVANSWGTLRVQALFHLFFVDTMEACLCRHKSSLTCVSTYNLMKDCIFLPMRRPEFYRAVLHNVRVVLLFAKAHQCRNVLLLISNPEISLSANKREDPI